MEPFSLSSYLFQKPTHHLWLGLEENHEIRLRLEAKIGEGRLMHYTNKTLSPCNGGGCSCPFAQRQKNGRLSLPVLRFKPFSWGKEGSAIIHCYDQSIVHLPNLPRCIRSLLVHPFSSLRKGFLVACNQLYCRVISHDFLQEFAWVMLGESWCI